MLWTLLFVACNTNGPRERPPIFTITDEGAGPTNQAPLLPLHTGTVMGTEDGILNHPYTWAFESPILRNGRPLHRMVFPDGVMYLEETEDGVLLHGTTINAWERNPLLLIPATVRDGMTWEATSNTGGTWEMAVSGNAETGTWNITRVNLETGATNGAEYVEGLGLAGSGDGSSRGYRRYEQGRVRSVDAEREPLDRSSQLALTSLDFTLPFDARHLSLHDRPAGRVLGVQSVLLRSEIDMDLLQEFVVWDNTFACLTVGDNGDLAIADGVPEGCEAMDDDRPDASEGYRKMATHGALSADRIVWGDPDQIAFGGMPTYGFDPQVAMEFVGRETRGFGPMSEPVQNRYTEHLGRALVVDLPGGNPSFGPTGDEWVTGQYLKTTNTDPAVRAVAELNAGDADDGDVLLSDGLGGWIQGALDDDLRPAGHPEFAFQKTGLPHYSTSPERRRALVTDADGALWSLDPGDTPLSFLGFVDLPDGHILTGAVHLNDDTLIIATTSGLHGTTETANGIGANDTTVTHFHTASLPEGAPYSAIDGMLGVANHGQHSTWVCEPEGVTSSTNLGEPLATDDRFASCRRFPWHEDPVVGGTALYGEPNYLEDFTETGLLVQDDAITDTRFVYTTTGLALDASPFAGVVTGAATGIERRSGYRDPWTYDIWGWVYDFDQVGFNQAHMAIDGNYPTVYPSSGGQPPIDVFPRAVGGGGRIVVDDTGTWIQDADTLRTPVVGGTFLAWADGRSCRQEPYGPVTCIGSDFVERSAFVGIQSFENINDRASALADTEYGYLLVDRHIVRLDPDTMELTALDTADFTFEGVPNYNWVSELVTQETGGRILYTDLDGVRSSVLDGVVFKHDPDAPGMPFASATRFEGVQQLNLVETEPRYVPAPPGTVYQGNGFRFALGDQSLFPATGPAMPPPPSSAWTYAGSTTLTTGETVVMEPDGTGYIAVRDTGLVRIALDGSETTTAWTTVVPDPEWLHLGQGRAHAVVYAEDADSDQTFPTYTPHVLDLTSGDLTEVPITTAPYITSDRWTGLSVDGATLIQAEVLPINPATLQYDLSLKRVDVATGTVTEVSADLPATGDYTSRMRLSPNAAVMAVDEPQDPSYPTSFIDTATGALILRADATDVEWAGQHVASSEGWFTVGEGPPALTTRLISTERDSGVPHPSTGELFSSDGQQSLVIAHPSRPDVVVNALQDGLKLDRPKAYFLSAGPLLLSADGNTLVTIVSVLEPGVQGTTEALRFTR